MMAKGRFLVLLLILCVVFVGCSVQSEPNAEQIKADLIGHQLTEGGFTAWEFAALSEYEQFDIRGTQRQGNILEYDVRDYETYQPTCSSWRIF